MKSGVVKIRKLSCACGFSIMEMIVATGIFAILVLATFGIFAAVLQAQQNTIAQTRIEREAQLVLETIAKKTRTSRVDYAEYESTNPIVNPVQELILIDQADSRVRFIYNATQRTVELQIDNGTPNTVTSNEIAVSGLDFFIEPTSDPFSSGLVPVTQPRVTVVLTMSATVGKHTVTATIQQTMPQRGAAF